VISLTLLFLFLLCFLWASIIISGSLQSVHYFLKVIKRDSQVTLLSIEVCYDDIFYLEYINSRDLNPIIDVFRVGGKGYFYLLEERYPWYGVGQEYHQSKDIFFEDGMVVVRLNKEMNILPLRVAYTVEQILKVNNKQYLLNSLAKSGEAIDLLVEVKGGQGNSE
jgi:hypothetical protein